MQRPGNWQRRSVPTADLVGDDDKNVIIKHSAGPTWTADGRQHGIEGPAVKNVSAPSPTGSIPWLLLTTNGAPGASTATGWRARPSSSGSTPPAESLPPVPAQKTGRRPLHRRLLLLQGVPASPAPDRAHRPANGRSRIVWERPFRPLLHRGCRLRPAVVLAHDAMLSMNSGTTRYSGIGVTTRVANAVQRCRERPFPHGDSPSPITRDRRFPDPARDVWTIPLRPRPPGIPPRSRSSQPVALWPPGARRAGPCWTRSPGA